MRTVANPSNRSVLGFLLELGFWCVVDVVRELLRAIFAPLRAAQTFGDLPEM